MKKRISLVLLMLIIIISIWRLNISRENDKLNITLGNQNLGYSTLEGIDINNNTHDLFEFAFVGEAFNDIRYVEIGEKVYLDFGDNPPDEFIVKDYLLDSKGKIMYTEKEVMDIPINGENEKYYFVVNKHIASALSSYYEKNKKEYRGINIITTEKGIEKSYLFVIKTI